jgi:hypothetical protein
MTINLINLPDRYIRTAMAPDRKARLRLSVERKPAMPVWA